MARSTGGSNEELPARLDSLLSSAIRERARDERALAEIFGGMRQEIEAFGKDLTSIKKAVQRPYQPILSLFSSKLAEIEHLVSDFRLQVSQRLEAAADLQTAHVAQESRALGKFVEVWSKYLDARLKQEAAAVAKLLEDSFSAADRRLLGESAEIKKGLKASTEKAEADLKAQMGAADARLIVVAEELQSQLLSAEGALRADIEVAQEALLESLSESSEAVSEALNEVTSVIPKQIGESLAEAFRPFSEELQKLGGTIEETSQRIADSNTRLEAIQRSLISYLSERDERLERVRDQALIDLVEKMADALKGRARTKIVGALKEGDRRRQDERDAARYRESIQGKISDAEEFQNPPDDRKKYDPVDEGGPWLSDSK